jgi:CRP-like cAMP-binding protein
MTRAQGCVPLRERIDRSNSLNHPAWKRRLIMMTGSQCRAARALVEYSRDRLATSSGIRMEIIEMFERKLDNPDEASVDALRSALENAGAVFLPDGEAGGIGVRLKFNRSETRRIATLEGEGGMVAHDDVP